MTLIDTNTVISGLLWSGPPQEIINAARARQITLYSSVALISEFAEVVAREKSRFGFELPGFHWPGLSPITRYSCGLSSRRRSDPS